MEECDWPVKYIGSDYRGTQGTVWIHPLDEAPTIMGLRPDAARIVVAGRCTPQFFLRRIACIASHRAHNQYGGKVAFSIGAHTLSIGTSYTWSRLGSIHRLCNGFLAERIAKCCCSNTRYLDGAVVIIEVLCRIPVHISASIKRQSRKSLMQQ